MTLEFWRKWIAKCTYTGRWRETVYRSALTLKLLTYLPTGTVVAAPTCSLPEWIGGHRNWDYRFTWIRDTAFTLYAFLRLGFTEEANAFIKWVEQRCHELNEDGSLDLMYGLRGEKISGEVILEHWDGYMGSRPVRIGNNAIAQLQLDIYGELLDTIYLANKYAEPISYDMWQQVTKLVDYVAKNWDKADDGIWETRTSKKQYTYSKVMCWVALDRGIRLAEKRSFPGRIHEWRLIRDKIYCTIMDSGFNEAIQAFTQTLAGNKLDASVLIMPLMLFISPTDPKFMSTMEAILKNVSEGGLVSNNLVFRYNVDVSEDGVSGHEGTFSICTFWAVEALSRVGRYRKDYLERARVMFEQIVLYGNHLGLFSEEVGFHGEALGNFPQAFSHLSLISAAYSLDRALDNNFDMI